MGTFFTPLRMWAITFGLLVFDVIVIYLFLNQPTVMSIQDSWDFRHDDLRRIELEQQRQLESSLSPRSDSVQDFIVEPQSTSPAQLLRPQLPVDSQGQVL